MPGTAPAFPPEAAGEHGFAAAAVNTKGKWFYGLLLTQSWRGIDPQAQPPGTSDTNPLGIAPFLNYQLGDGWYVGNGDMVIQFNWDSGDVFIPIGVRLGKVIGRPQRLLENTAVVQGQDGKDSRVISAPLQSHHLPVG